MNHLQAMFTDSHAQRLTCEPWYPRFYHPTHHKVAVLVENSSCACQVQDHEPGVLGILFAPGRCSGAEPGTPATGDVALLFAPPDELAAFAFFGS